MKKVYDILTAIAALVFMWAMCAIESLDPSVLAALLISGGWMAVYAMVWEANRKAREGR